MVCKPGAMESAVAIADEAMALDAAYGQGLRAPAAYEQPCADLDASLSLMETLEIILTASTDEEDNAERRHRQRTQLMCGVAAEDRRWRAERGEANPGMKRGRNDGLALGVVTLLELAEQAVGLGVRRTCEELLPNVNWCGLAWTPAPVDDNQEPCRIKRQRPAVEDWMSE